MFVKEQVKIMLETLCKLNGTSGDENVVRKYIISQIASYCDYSQDAIGNIIAFKKGKKKPSEKLMLCAHMDEVGFIVTGITDEGYLRFDTVGGIDSRAVIDRCVRVNDINGVIGTKAIHQTSEAEKKKAPTMSELFIDIGAESEADARKYVREGDYAYFVSDYTEFGNGYIKAKALDDRIGCMLLIELIKSDLEYDTYFAFNVQEEVGLRGAKCSAYSVNPDIAIVLEATTAADLCGVTGSDRVCVLGNGPVVSFMDGRTIYDKTLFELAFDISKELEIPCQTKTAIAGGNDAGAVQTSRGGVRTLAVSLPCRYIHSASSVVKQSDIDFTRKLIKELINRIYD